MKTTRIPISLSIVGFCGALLLGAFLTTGVAADKANVVDKDPGVAADKANVVDKELFSGPDRVILTAVDKTEERFSPTKGNNGVGNGIDPAPPGNPPQNDGPGTSPGNPGNKGGTPGHDKP